jgi:hypothetical protein
MQQLLSIRARPLLPLPQVNQAVPSVHGLACAHYAADISTLALLFNYDLLHFLPCSMVQSLFNMHVSLPFCRSVM